MSAPTLTPQRTWTKVGRRYTTAKRRPQVLAEIEQLDWRPVPKGKTMSLPMMPGEGISAVIAELRLPKVSALAWNGGLSFPARSRDGDGEYPGLYGIEANYSNGRARLYLIDNGCEILPIISDFWPTPASD